MINVPQLLRHDNEKRLIDNVDILLQRGGTAINNLSSNITGLTAETCGAIHTFSEMTEETSSAIHRISEIGGNALGSIGNAASNISKIAVAGTIVGVAFKGGEMFWAQRRADRVADEFIKMSEKQSSAVIKLLDRESSEFRQFLARESNEYRGMIDRKTSEFGSCMQATANRVIDVAQEEVHEGIMVAREGVHEGMTVAHEAVEVSREGIHHSVRLAHEAVEMGREGVHGSLGIMREGMHSMLNRGGILAGSLALASVGVSSGSRPLAILALTVSTISLASLTLISLKNYLSTEQELQEASKDIPESMSVSLNGQQTTIWTAGDLFVIRQECVEAFLAIRKKNAFGSHEWSVEELQWLSRTNYKTFKRVSNKMDQFFG
jgi:hypothetical protein